MDREQLDLFRTAFKQANHGNLSLPNEIDISKIYDIETYPNGMRDGYSARFRFTKDDNNNYQIELENVQLRINILFFKNILIIKLLLSNEITC